MQRYENKREFFEANGLDEFKNYNEAHTALINALGYKHALNILHRYLTDNKLVSMYKDDEHLNNVYKFVSSKRLNLPSSLKQTCRTAWEWDVIGWLIYSGQDNIKFKSMSLSDMTGIAKTTARMRVMELTNQKEGDECIR